MTTKVSDERLKELVEIAVNFVEAFDEIPLDDRPSPESAFTDDLAALRELQEKRALVKECEAYLRLYRQMMIDYRPASNISRLDALLARVRGEI